MPPGPARNIAHHVYWNLQHNFSQKSGVPPQFRTAILVTRRMSTAASRFKAEVSIAVRGGIGMKLRDLADVFFRRNAPDKPVVFDPSIKFMGEKLEGLEPNAEGIYELGHLALGRELVKLCAVWGLDPLPAPAQRNEE